MVHENSIAGGSETRNRLEALEFHHRHNIGQHLSLLAPQDLSAFGGLTSELPA